MHVHRAEDEEWCTCVDCPEDLDGNDVVDLSDVPTMLQYRD